MVSRIVVVLSQSLAHGSDRRDLEEDIVGELLGAAGIELTIVSHLENLDDTGRLCLEGISTDMIVLSWLDPQKAHSALIRHGIRGQFSQPGGRDAGAGETKRPTTHAVAEFGADSSRRTIYHIDLTKFQSGAILRQQVCRVRDEAAAQVVDPLQVIPHPSDGSRGRIGGERARQPGIHPVVPAPAQRDDADNSDVSRVEVRRTRTGAPAGAARAPGEQATIDELDDLLDQFDNLEL